jgi:hypothetical protein
MAKRMTEVERVTSFFEEAEFVRADTVFDVVKGVMKKRAVKEGKATKKKDKPEPPSTQSSLPAGRSGYQETTLESGNAAKTGAVATSSNQSK